MLKTTFECRYVSDHAYDGYRAICQQKLMHSYAMNPALARAYPPTVMEWKANRKCVNMALEARYPDGMRNSVKGLSFVDK